MDKLCSFNVTTLGLTLESHHINQNWSNWKRRRSICGTSPLWCDETDSAAASRPDYWVRNEPFYRNVAGWDYGKMLDFISYSTWINNFASVVAYGKDETGADTINQGDVVFFYRIAGSNSTWSSRTATKDVE